MLKGINKTIRNSFLYYRAYVVWIAVTCMLVTFLFTTYCCTQEINAHNEIVQLEKDYGSYTFKMCGLKEADLEMIAQDTSVESYLVTHKKSVVLEDEFFEYIRVSEEFFEYSNYSIVEGMFPKKSDEIMVPKWYMHQLGIEPDKMVGSVIELENPDTGKQEKKKVSGLVVLNRNAISSVQLDSSNFFIMGEETSTFQNEDILVYVKLKNMKAYESVSKSLVEKMKNKNVQVEWNYQLLLIKGYIGQGGISKLQRNIIYGFVLTLLFVITLVLIKNVILVCLEKWKKTIGVYKIIGADMEIVRNNVLMIFEKYCLIGSFSGILLGIIFTVMYTRIHQMYMQFPFVWIVLQVVFLYIGLRSLLFRRFEEYSLKTAYDVTSDKERTENIFLEQKKLFCGVRFGILKLSFRNFCVYNKKKTTGIVSIAVCILMLFIVNVQMQQNTNNTDDNKEFQYKVEVADYYDLAMRQNSQSHMASVVSTCDKIETLCEQSGCTIYYLSGYHDEVRIPKTSLTEEYKEMLAQSIQGYTMLHDSRDYITAELKIMGYSPEMIKELAKEQNCELPKLEFGEAIFLMRITNQDGKGGQGLSSMDGQSFTYETAVSDESGQSWEEVTYRIVGEVDNLSVYPDSDENVCCMIIDFDEYKTYYNSGYPTSFYLNNVDDSLISKLQEILEGNTGIKIIDLEDEAKNVKAGYQKRMLLMICVLILSCFFSVVNLYVQNVFEYDYRKKEFILLETIGISERKKNVLISLETIYVYLFGLGIGLLCCKLLQNLLYQFCIVQVTHLPKEFMLTGIGIIVFFMIGATCFLCHMMRKNRTKGR